jgi:hypothetical protein
MAVRSYTLALSGSAQLTSVYVTTPSLNDPRAAAASLDIPYRQITFQATGANLTLGTNNPGGPGLFLTAGAAPITIGPFETGPVKFSDFWANGSGATLQILAVPF